MAGDEMRKLKQYCKKVLTPMLILWFIGAIYLMVIVGMELLLSYRYPQYAIVVHVPELAAYIGAPLGSGFVVYLIKSAYENREKIKQNPDYNDYQNYNNYTGGNI